MVSEEKINEYLKELEHDNIFLKPVNSEIYEKLSKEEHRDLVKRIISSRYNNYEEYKLFKDTKLSTILSRPFMSRLIGIQDASNAINEVIENNGFILHICDYDVDGVTSGAIGYKMYKNLFEHTNFEIMVNRREWSNGINNTIVNKILELSKTRKIDLIITSDHGSHDKDRLKILKDKLNCKIVVTDHHLFDEKDSVQSVVDGFVNPQRNDNKDLKQITGANVLYFTLLYSYLDYITKHPEYKTIVNKDIVNINTLTKLDYIYYLLSYVAMTIISDVVDVKFYVNRKLLIKGLSTINSKTVIHEVFWELAKERLSTSYFIDETVLGFDIVPALNSAGRIDNPRLAYELLITEHKEKAIEFEDNILELNNKRKDIQNTAMLREDILEYKSDRVYVALIKDSEGVQGNIANNILFNSNYSVVICFTEQVNERGKIFIGSGRLSGNGNLKELLDKINEEKDIIIDYGGHKQACGIKIKPKLKEFFKSINKLVNEHDIKKEDKLFIDEVIYSNRKLFTSLFDVKVAGPYGMGYPKPLFVSDVYLHSFRIFTKKNKKYLNAKVLLSPISDFKVNLFYSLTKNDIENNLHDEIKNVKKLRLVYTISINTYMSNNQILLNVEKLDILE